MARVVELADVEAAAKAKEDALWGKFFNGEPWICDKEIDYYGDPHVLIRALRYRASKRGMKIRLLAIDDNSFTFVAYKPDRDNS